VPRHGAARRKPETEGEPNGQAPPRLGGSRGAGDLQVGRLDQAVGQVLLP
jgi:hypothetical protein